MMNNHHLRGIILKLENRLSDDDRKRLHFFLGNDVPRRIRDDPSLGGTLSLMESLFDQDKINEQDFTFLINAFDEIQCMDAVKLLRDHMRRMQQSNTLNQSIQSLASIMPPTIDQSIEAQDEDRYAIHCPLITQRNISENSIEMIGINNTDISPVTEIVDNQSSLSNRKKLSNRSSMRQKCLLLFALLLLSIIGLGALTGVIILRSRQFIKELKMKDKSIFEEQTKNNQILKQLNSLRSMVNGTTQQLIDQLEQSRDEQTKQNETIQRLTNQLQQSLKEHTKNNHTIQQLTNELKQSLKEQAKNNQTTQQLTDELQQSRNEQRKQNETIQQLNNQLKLSCEKPTLSNRNNVTIGKSGQTIGVVSTPIPTSTRFPHIEPNMRWRQNGFTVAGGYEEDNDFNSALHPYGFAIDDDQTIIVADYNNHRVLEWKFSATSGEVVAGGNEQGNRNDQLNYPTDVLIDKQADKLIICDRQNWRVVRWHRRGGRSGETIISHVKCFGLAMDTHRFLYVSDLEKHEVRRWRVGETQGALVAGGNGRGDRFDQLNSPQFIFIDRDHSVFVSDSDNHRVMKWIKDAKEGIIVAGGQGEGTALTQLSSSEGIFVDQLESVYVADCSNHRIMRWSKGATQGTLVVGGNQYGNQPNELNCPMGLSFDLDGNLYVADYNNNRVQKFDVNRVR